MKHRTFVAVVIFASLGYATDRTVGPPGSGAQFTSIQAAIDAAQPGDRVVVMAGEYTGTLVLTKPIDIVGAGFSATFSRSLGSTFPGAISTPAVVTAIPAGTRARISGITFAFGGTMVSPSSSIMTVHTCAGRVELVDLALAGASLPPLSGPSAGAILSIVDCAQVVASGIHTGGSLYTQINPVPGEVALSHGQAGIRVQASSLWMADCLAFGNASRFVSSGFGGDGGPGLVAVDSAVHAASCLFVGAQSGGHANGVPGLCAPGIEAAGSSLVVHGGSNVVFGALVFQTTINGVVGVGLPGNAIVLDSLSSFTYASDVALIPGPGFGPIPTPPAVAAATGATVTALAHRLPTVTVSQSTVLLGTTVAIRLTGEPSLPHIRAVTLQTGPAIPVAGAVGLLVADLTTLLAFETVLLDTFGEATTLVTVPADPILTGLSVVQQAAQILPIGIALSPPAVFSIGF